MHWIPLKVSQMLLIVDPFGYYFKARLCLSGLLNKKIKILKKYIHSHAFTLLNMRTHLYIDFYSPAYAHAPAHTQRRRKGKVEMFDRTDNIKSLTYLSSK